MQDTVNERLKILVEALGTNPGSLSKMLGISPSTLRNYIDRDSKPGYEVIEKLFNSFKHINLPWLFGAPGEPLLTNTVGSTNLNTITAHKNKGNVQGNSGGTNTINNVKLEDCQRDLTVAQKEIALLTSQLADEERTIQILMKQSS